MPANPPDTTYTPRQLAKLLTEAGGHPVTADWIRADVKAGAPAEPDGKINLVHYVAWLVKQRKS